MILSTVVKEKREPLTWRHFVLGAYWIVTALPMLLFILGGILAELGDNTLGRLRRWANPESYVSFRNYDYTEGGEW